MPFFQEVAEVQLPLVERWLSRRGKGKPASDAQTRKRYCVSMLQCIYFELNSTTLCDRETHLKLKMDPGRPWPAALILISHRHRWHPSNLCMHVWWQKESGSDLTMTMCRHATKNSANSLAQFKAIHTASLWAVVCGTPTRKLKTHTENKVS